MKFKTIPLLSYDYREYPKEEKSHEKPRSLPDLAVHKSINLETWIIRAYFYLSRWGLVDYLYLPLNYENKNQASPRARHPGVDN